MRYVCMHKVKLAMVMNNAPASGSLVHIQPDFVAIVL
jgi:hypothetical protein